MERAIVLVAAVLLPASAGGGDDVDRRLLEAVRRGDAGSVAVLLREGARPDAREGAGRGGLTALHEAVQTGDRASLVLLLDAGAAPDLRARSGGTPLDVAERAGRLDLARLLRAHGARGSGKSIGDTVCVRPWGGDGYCGVVEAPGATHVGLRLARLVGCASGCAPEAACSAGRPVGAGGLGPGDAVRVPWSCLTHTGVVP